MNKLESKYKLHRGMAPGARKDKSKGGASTSKNGSSKYYSRKQSKKTSKDRLSRKRHSRTKNETSRRRHPRGLFDTMMRNIHESVYAEVDALNPPNTISLNCLHHAIARGDAHTLHSLLASGASPNDVDVEGDTPLLLAVISHRVDFAKLLIKAGAKVNAYTDSEGNTCLHHAIMKRNVEMVQLLLSARASLTAVNSEKYTPLLMAFKRRDVSHMDDVAGLAGPQHHCSIPHPDISEEDVEIIRLLLKAGASVNSVGKKGDTPLTLAVRSEHIDLVQLLIDAGADVNYVNRKSDSCGQSTSPLHEAVHVCNVEILRLLLSQGADPNRANQLRYTVLYDASSAKRNRIPMLNLLLDHGADMYNSGSAARLNNFSSLPFERRLRKNDVKVVRLFLERGYDLNRYRSQGDMQLTPLHEAVQYFEGGIACTINTKDTAMLELLMDHYEAKGTLSSEVEREDSRGRTPLSSAVHGKPLHTKLLLQAGADPNHEDRNGMTPFEGAVLFNRRVHHKIIKLLIQSGADLRNVIKRLIDVARSEGATDTPRRSVSGELSTSESSVSDSDDSDKDALQEFPDNFNNLLMPPRIFYSMDKALCVVKYRVLYESQFCVDDPIRYRIKCSSTLRNYYRACEAEIAFLKNYQFDESVTAYDLLTEEEFWRRVKSSDAFENFRNESLPDSEGEVFKNIQIYSDEVWRSWDSGYYVFELWKSASKGLECLLGFDKDSYHLIFSNVLDRLDNEDWRNLSEIAGFSYNDANNDAGSHSDSETSDCSDDFVEF